jgi:hypothetical protein
MPVKRTILWASVAMVFLSIAAASLQADDTDVTPPGAPAAVDETHPIYSADSHWVAGMLACAGGLFLAALVVGRLVRTEKLRDGEAEHDRESDPAENLE